MEGHGSEISCVLVLFFQDSDAINLSTRDNTVAFMLDLSRHCSFHSETYSLSVNLLDRLLSVVKVSKLGLKVVFILGQMQEY